MVEKYKLKCIRQSGLKTELRFTPRIPREFLEKKLNFTVVPDDINWKQNNWENFCCIV